MPPSGYYLRRYSFALAVAFLSLVVLAVPVSAVSGSIGLQACGGKAATWSKTTVTVRIDNIAGLGSSQVAAVAAAIQEWNNALANGVFTSYQLGQILSGTADIVIQLYYKVTPGYILGYASITCGSGNSIASALVVLGLKGLTLIGVQNLAAHELGHALGLGHANVSSDLLYPSFDKSERKIIFCPSNLDVGAIKAASGGTTTTLSYSVSTWQALSC